ncbi:NAD(P)-binding protein [Lepidopterella palustris CBS 459.81]|uniref:NAD(P)-binding protein n=1 Tax=Lepidopterella palustris CBS 459.81 TaxID=1314670 RepID=A0A8E2JA89_9PEZI|nr:NAD(P)-binding protein [Lepidopterella palustris CBS 459.81]
MPPVFSFAPPGSFVNRTVLVTGAAGTIGKPLCLAFASAGANVIVNDLGGSYDGTGSSTSPAHAVVAEIQQNGGSAIASTHSVTDAEAIISIAISTFGRLDIIINNAGITHYGLLETQTPATFRQVFETNALAPMALLHHAWPLFQAQSYGRVVNFSSDAVFGMPNSSPYVLSRGAMLGVTRSLALEGAPHNIRVNAIGPTSYSRMMEPMMQDLPPQHREATKASYSGESNVPLILALAHESCEVSGQIFSSGGNGIGRLVLGTVKQIGGIMSMEDAQRRLPELLERGREWVEPMSIQEFADFRARGSD